MNLIILRDHRNSYKFFRWLNSKFNGDLFPGKGATEEEREARGSIIFIFCDNIRLNCQIIS
jgi:hypothetical protein